MLCMLLLCNTCVLELTTVLTVGVKRRRAEEANKMAESAAGEAARRQIMKHAKSVAGQQMLAGPGSEHGPDAARQLSSISQSGEVVPSPNEDARRQIMAHAQQACQPERGSQKLWATVLSLILARCSAWRRGGCHMPIILPLIFITCYSGRRSHEHTGEGGC